MLQSDPFLPSADSKEQAESISGESACIKICSPPTKPILPHTRHWILGDRTHNYQKTGYKAIKLTHWESPKQIREVVLHFDTDFDHPLESVLITHPETVMPFCVRDFVLYNDQNERIYEQTGNYLTQQIIRFDTPIETNSLNVHLKQRSGSVPVSLVEIRCYE